MILPAMKKYEAKLTQAKDNFQHIADEVSVIGAQFAAIWHEVKEIVTKIAHDEPTIENTIQSTIVSNVSVVDWDMKNSISDQQSQTSLSSSTQIPIVVQPSPNT